MLKEFFLYAVYHSPLHKTMSQAYTQSEITFSYYKSQYNREVGKSKPSRKKNDLVIIEPSRLTRSST